MVKIIYYRHRGRGGHRQQAVWLVDNWIISSSQPHKVSSRRQFIIIIIIIYPLTARVVGAPQMSSQPVSFIFPCSPPPSGPWQTPGLSIPWCCLPTSSSVCLVFFSLSLCLATRFWPDLMNGRHDHITAVCIFLRWTGGLRVVELPAGSSHGLPRWKHGLRMRCVVSCGSTIFPWLVFFVRALPWGSMIHKHTGKWMWQGIAPLQVS